MKLSDPNEMPRGAKRFIAWWLRDITTAFDNFGFRALLPVGAMICAATGAVIGYWSNPKLWNDTPTAIAFYAAIFAVNAIFLAICWASFARMLDVMGDPDFGAWMRMHGLHGMYSFYIDYIQLTQMLAVAAAASGLVVSVLPVPELGNRAVLGIAVASSMYAARWTAGCVTVMQELGEHRAKFRQVRTNVSHLPLALEPKSKPN